MFELSRVNRLEHKFDFHRTVNLPWKSNLWAFPFKLCQVCGDGMISKYSDDSYEQCDDGPTGGS